jgi:predicted HTH domain antitoxin
MRWKMITKTIRLPEDISERISYRAKKEDIDESVAIRQLIKLGLREYAVNLYREKKATLREACELADVSLREMLELLMEHGIKGNVTMKQQQRSLEYVESLLEAEH